tara:strand:+ start:148 stop:342 length:195 start_codon:yes stop_codon:yes gene_type:complete
MAKTQNDLDIYYAVENANTAKQETEIREIIKTGNSLEWTLVATSTTVVDSMNQFSFVSLLGEIK